MAQKRSNSNNDSPDKNKKTKINFWNQGLKASMQDPNLIVDSDEEIVIIKDKYPKARHHYLILPKTDIPNLKILRREHLRLLKHMHKKALELTEKVQDYQNFRYGYHSVPSMRQLHLHVISQDFDSPCLKTKTHWNSFTTEYFVDSDELIKQIESYGQPKNFDAGNAKELLKMPLRCHVCKVELSTMPKLKMHILKHCK